MNNINIEIKEISITEKPILENMMKMYCYEWSQYNLFDIDEKGQFPFEKYLHYYFEKPNRYNYFILVNGILAGFALVDDDFPIKNNSDYSLGEFFIMYKYRRLGIGSYLANYLFDKYKGKWQIGFHPHNIISNSFWIKVVSEYTNGNFELVKNCDGLKYNDGSFGSVLIFNSDKKNEEISEKL